MNVTSMFLSRSTSLQILTFDVSIFSNQNCRNPSFGLATKAKGLQGWRPRGNSGVKAKGSSGVKARRSPKVMARGSLGVKARGSPGFKARRSPWVLESVREYEGMNPHTPKATPTLGDGIPVDFQNFREQFEGSKLNALWRSLYHWKDFET